MRNKFFIIGSTTLGIIVLASVAGSLLFLKRPATITQDATKENAPSDAPPAPAVVTVDALSPEELVRLVLQMWYTRDFGGMYTLLDASFQTKESRETFIARMEKLPAIASINIRNTKRTNGEEGAVTLTLQIDAKTDKGEIKRDVLFTFNQTAGRWKITALPDFNL